MIMYQGEFIERLLDIDKIVTEQDVRDFVKAQSKGQLPSLIGLINQECGWLFRVRASKIPEVEAYREKQRRRVSFLIQCVKEQTGQAIRMFPDFLTERGVKAFVDAISVGLIDKDSFAWVKDDTVLCNWVADINAAGGVTTKLGCDKKRDWASFEKYFGKKRYSLSKKYEKSCLNHSCIDYDPVKAKIFPELYKH